MLSKEIEDYKLTLKLSSRQKEILISVLLGDGHLERLYKPNLARLKIEHSINQKEYVDWLYAEFQNWTRSKPRARKVKAFGRVYGNYGFCTYGHKALGKFQKMFYKERNKIVPSNIEKLLTRLGLAVWYMDDGSIKSAKHKGVFLNTQGFRIEDIERLQNALRNKFGVNSTTRKEKNGRQIYIGGENGKKFIELIKQYIIPSMRYKIPRVLI